MNALIGLLAIAAILALLGGAAQRWGVDSREGSLDANAPRPGLN
ncbi:MAG: hypothetical protein ACRDGQ_13985 [Candidatus Limnocylindrales bacterium]